MTSNLDLEVLKSQWRSLAPAWIDEVRAGKHSIREGLLDDVVLEACGALAGVRALDSGCGEGRFCRLLLRHGARSVLGIDLCEEMIAAARELQSDGDRYQVANVEDLSFLHDGSFELVVSYLNQCDLPDFANNTREIFRVLASGGRFVVANLHPMRSAVGRWCRDEHGSKRHAILDDYFDESERFWDWMGDGLTNFHRSLSSYLNEYLSAGFVLRTLIEPKASAQQLERFPDLDDEVRVPNFIVFVLDKP